MRSPTYIERFCLILLCFLLSACAAANNSSAQESLAQKEISSWTEQSLGEGSPRLFLVGPSFETRKLPIPATSGAKDAWQYVYGKTVPTQLSFLLGVTATTYSESVEGTIDYYLEQRLKQLQERTLNKMPDFQVINKEKKKIDGQDCAIIEGTFTDPTWNRPAQYQEYIVTISNRLFQLTCISVPTGDENIILSNTFFGSLKLEK